MARTYLIMTGFVGPGTLAVTGAGVAGYPPGATFGPRRLEDCGFANPYHFSRRFHRTYGQPPGRYRRAATRLEPTEPLAQAGLLALGDRIWRAT